MDTVAEAKAERKLLRRSTGHLQQRLALLQTSTDNITQQLITYELHRQIVLGNRVPALASRLKGWADWHCERSILGAFLHGLDLHGLAFWVLKHAQ